MTDTKLKEFLRESDASEDSDSTKQLKEDRLLRSSKVEPKDDLLSKTTENRKEPSRAKELIINLLQLLFSVILGYIFGWAMEKAKVHEPVAIRQQMIFQKFIMMKMFFSALATSTLIMLILSFIPKVRDIYNTVFEGYRSSLTNKSFFSIILGASLIGVGMQISGACPGMVLVQCGAGIAWSWLTLIGAFLGAFAHGLLNSYFVKNMQPDPIMSKTIFELIKLPSFVTRGVFVILLAVGVFLMEYFIPYGNEYANPVVEGSTNIFIYKAWPPFACGILLGFLQLFSIIFLSKSLGASSFYSTIVGIPFFTKKSQEMFPYFAKFRSGWANMAGIGYACGAILGGFTSSWVSGVWGKAQGVHPYNAIFGGFIMVFGARIAGGCTSGHGISGSSHQYIGSLIAMASMFAGGIAFGFYALTNSFFN